ncbi:MAG: Mur ligase [Hyphobacterium sp.]|nr:MAG: Mur ligase [Hyphobacterium sp.]
MTEHADIIEEALEIRIPTSERLVLNDTRRLTGPGLLWDYPGAVLDVLFRDFDANIVISAWHGQARRVLDAIGWAEQRITSRAYEGGVSLAISAPMDQLYSATFAAQTAWHFCAARLLKVDAGDFDTMIADLTSLMTREANPRLLDLIKRAEAHGVGFLVDDDVFSLGYGKASSSWPVLDLPKPDAVNWSKLADIPVAMITGTNGKTTTTRLACAMARAAGKIAGLTSTDMVSVGDNILDRGDYSGPGGARLLLRDRRLEMAYLEVARGGILRRGLPLTHARAALVTNVAADHLGQFGINTVEELATTKLAVHRALGADGILVLNADDALVVAEAANLAVDIHWFSLDPENTNIARARAHNRPCGWLDGTTLMLFDGVQSQAILDVDEIPITMKGAARYNVRNALGAACLSQAMGVGIDAMRTGLRHFQNDPKDNPGRCNEFVVKGARVFVDFAHNPHSIEAVTSAMRAIPAKRRFVMLSHAGDRSDQDIVDVTASALAMNPDHLIASELSEHLRGRNEGDVTRLIIKVARSRGLNDDQILHASSPADGAAQILDRLQEGDLALLLVLSERDAIFEMLEKQAM